MIALLIAYQSIERLLHPVAIAYGEAIAIASLGLVWTYPGFVER